MAGALPIFSVFECEDLINPGPCWTKRLGRFEVLLSAMDVCDAEPEKSLLLHYLGAECYDIYESLKDEADDYITVKAKMNDNFVSKCNSEFERYIFQLSVNCDFTERPVENEVKTQMICGCTSKSTRKKLVKTEVLKGHRKRFPKLVKMLVLFTKISFSQRYNNFFPRNKLQ